MVEPVLTVTPNTALDRCLLVPDFAFGRTVVATDSTLAMAGKPADMSLVLAELGVPSLATGLMGGRTGALMVRMLEQAGVKTAFLRVPGRTRVNVGLIQEGAGLQGTVTVPSVRPGPEDGERLLAQVESLLPGRRWLIVGGSLPDGVAPDLYQRMIEAGRRAGARVLLDASGQTLLDALPACPTIAKPNEVELGAAVGQELRSLDDVVTAARSLCRQGVEVVVVTLGHQGSVCVSGDEAYLVPPVSVPVVNTAGAGDAFGAGMVKAFLEGGSVREALRWGTAAATAVLLTLGTAHCRREDVLRLLPQVHIEPLS